MSLRQGHLIIALISTTVIISVLIMEYGFDLKPCQLCLWQRWPWYIMVVLSISTLFMDMGRGRLPQILFIVFLLLAMTSMALGLYHFGVEQNFWLGPQQCIPLDKGLIGDEANLSQLLEEATSTKTVACDQASALFLGMSLAAWNMIGSFVMALFILSLSVKQHQQR